RVCEQEAAFLGRGFLLQRGRLSRDAAAQKHKDGDGRDNDPLHVIHDVISWREAKPRYFRSTSRKPAIHDKGSASDVTARVAGHQKRGADKLLRVGPTIQRRHLGKTLLLFLAQDARRQVGQEWPRGNAVDRDAERPEIESART